MVVAELDGVVVTELLAVLDCDVVTELVKEVDGVEVAEDDTVVVVEVLQ